MTEEPADADTLGPPLFEVPGLRPFAAFLGLVGCLAAAGFFITTGPALYYDWPGHVQHESAAREIALTLASIVIVFLAVWTATILLWRLVGRDRFTARVHEQGLRLHPSRCRRLIPWTEISRSRVKIEHGGEGGPHKGVELELTRPIYSLTYPFGKRRLFIADPAQFGPARRIPDLARHIRARRRKAGWKR
jgi:hypothetical protein